MNNNEPTNSSQVDIKKVVDDCRRLWVAHNQFKNRVMLAWLGLFCMYSVALLLVMPTSLYVIAGISGGLIALTIMILIFAFLDLREGGLELW